VISAPPRLFSPGDEKRGFRNGLVYNMDRVVDKACRGSEVPLMAFWCKARVRWRVACDKPLGKDKELRCLCVYGKVNIS
jgi:hypothetical protein